MSDVISYDGCWLSHRRHGDAIYTSPRLIMSQYTSLQLICFNPMSSGSLPEERNLDGIIEYRRPPGARILFQPENRKSITILRLRVYRKDVEAKLDYGLRLASGLDVKQDLNAALQQFRSIVDGPYPNDMRAYAASLACSCCEHDSVWNPETQVLCFHMANESFKLGLFSFPAYICVNQMMRHARLKDIQLITAIYPLLVAAYDAITKGAGSQIGLHRQCAACGTRLKRRSGFKTCAGPCKELKKPVYCNKECQKSDWKNHRRWCTAQPSGDEALKELALRGQLSTQA